MKVVVVVASIYLESRCRRNRRYSIWIYTDTSIEFAARLANGCLELSIFLQRNPIAKPTRPERLISWSDSIGAIATDDRRRKGRRAQEIPSLSCSVYITKAKMKETKEINERKEEAKKNTTNTTHTHTQKQDKINKTG